MTIQRLDQLLQGLADTAPWGGLAVSGLTLHSRDARPGVAFVALRGTRQHGMAFAADAVARGAVAVIAEAPVPSDLPELGVPVVWVNGLAARIGEIAARFHGEPSRHLRVIGVTGTNGKTSTVQLLAQALHALGHRAATIGTLGTGLVGELREGERTTPDAINVQATLAAFRDAGASHVAMEVSSHALVQGRVNGVAFELAAFTNLTRDHLDYHGTMKAYGEAKARLFAWPGLRAAVINVDDAFGAALAERLPAGVAVLRVSAAGLGGADVVAEQVVTSGEGLAFLLRTPWGSRPVRSPLLGRFNVANLLTVVACLGALGESFEDIVEAVQALAPVNGRMNRLGDGLRQPLVVVDYAHTPDALEQALTALRAHCAGRLLCVFGCGGERDAGKRPVMGAIAERLADVAIVTDDNPRGEDGDAIVAQIVAGFADPARARVERDRETAIRLALSMARAGDVLLVAGKGHETYQEGAHGKRPFDDMEVARVALEACA
ncbi:UDP-N-acetylmuramoyl-L-alanyl-D-glutamate-2,6-diaminopimelate ligase [Dyella thiooxydans]|uniref:UDP-N-acetylmuramoyl-L-alanyl-D-glutamate--2,6-diaminopimelate ligase n=1 Tax=Dyella thiooxydans TaxID=445710 RepID=A0A160N333_9GAMM|nr:UDP-N-acetylmuramoyl-L-alanyl-D-glutamate--2,6-diaminopimelate ligase [Dyella thiooxydans]AND69752.1 UDP-N-acetylmuramoyl-L-alanyl-D-glutamate-2,6-diaminopimelate ligase [Dyella thiooxydans]